MGAGQETDVPTAFYRADFDESKADWRDKATPGTSRRDDAKLLILRIGITVENVCNRQAIEILKRSCPSDHRIADNGGPKRAG